MYQGILMLAQDEVSQNSAFLWPLFVSAFENAASETILQKKKKKIANFCEGLPFSPAI